jgi:hypothetical protein
MRPRISGTDIPIKCGGLDRPAASRQDAASAPPLPRRGIDSIAELTKSPFYSSLFEGFVASAIVKAQSNARRRRELYYFRDQQGLEVDFLMPGRSGSVALVECKTTHTATPAMAGPMQRLAEALRRQRPPGTAVALHLVHQAPRTPVATRALAPGVQAWAWQEFVAQL